MKKGFMKKIIGLSVVVATSALFSFAAYASDNVVTQTKDNVTVTKTAEWTKLDGKETDSSGNPYINVKFKIDTTKMDTSITDKVKTGGDVDVVLVLDNSMSYQDKFPKAKKAVAEFVDDVMSLKTNKVKVGVVKFGLTAETMIGLSDNMTEVKKAVEKIELQGTEITGTNMHHGVCNATDLLKGSTAKTKLMIIFSDGRPNRTKEIITEHNRDRARKAVKDKLQKARTEVTNNLEIVTIGYFQDGDNASVEFMKDIASTDNTGKKMTYKTGKVFENLESVFETVSNSVVTYTVGKCLVDTIPNECSIIESSFKANDANMKRAISNDKHTVSFAWGEDKLEKKVYEVTFVMTLDKSKLTDKQLKGEEKIYTNGSTININAETLGSSMFVYNDTGIIKLTSPKLLYKESNEVTVKEDKKQQEQTKEDKKDDLDKSPATGDGLNVSVIGIMMLALVVASGVGIYIKKLDN